MKTKQILVATFAAALSAHAFAVDTDCPSKSLQGVVTSFNWVKTNTISSLVGQSFEGCSTVKTTSGLTPNQVSANEYWTMFGGTIGNFPNPGSVVKTQCVPTTAPGPNYFTMMQVTTNKANTGILQTPNPIGATKTMFSVYVFVKKGGVQIRSGTSGTTLGSTSHSIKKGEWEQLRVCTDGSVNVNQLVIQGTDPTGSDFYVDRAELYRMP
jgi:hypothetical protein